MPEAEHKTRRRIAWGATAGVGLALVGVAVWFFVGHRVWTDGGSLRVADGDARIREVLWDKPQPVEGIESDTQIYEPSVSPDGTELYFVRGKAGGSARIFVSLRKNNAWSKPAPVDAVNGEFDSLGPRVTADGKFLLFYSNRPGGLGGYDIWAAPRKADGWGAPFNLGPSVNSEFNEFNPDPTPDGKRLIFATNRKAARREQNEAWRSTIRETVSSDYDLWSADADTAAAAPAPPTQTVATTEPTTRPTTGPVDAPAGTLRFAAAREIPGVNTPFSEGASCMSPAGDFLYFASNRPGGQGKFDIYRSRLRDGKFDPPENVGPTVNTAENESDPALAFNGFRMYFSSDRPGADGRYHLLFTDSREVYPERLGRPMPHLGWSWWLLIASVVILVPLLMFLRGWEDHRLSTLQRCLLLSLLVHAIISFILSFVVVTQQVTQYVRKEMGLEVAVNLNAAQGVDESIAIRGQVSNDLPTSSAPPAAMTAARAAAPDDLPTAGPADVAVPGARLAPGGMTVAVAPARHASAAPAPAPEPVAVATPTAAPGALDLPAPAVRAVRGSEAAPQARAVEPQASRAAVGELPLPAAPTIAGPALANVARPTRSELTSDVPVRANPAAVVHAVGGPTPNAVASASGTGDVNPTLWGGTKVSGAERTVAARDEASSTGRGAQRSTPDSSAAAPQIALGSASMKPDAAAQSSAASGPPAPTVHVSTGGASAAGPSVAAAATGDVAGPRVQVAAASARASGREPAVTPSAGDAKSAAAGPLGGTQNAASGEPGHVEVGSAPVAGAPTPLDVPVAMNAGASRTARQGGANLSGSATTRPSAVASATSPDVSLAPAGGVARATAAEPTPVVASAGTGPTTRPTALASAVSATGAGAPDALDLGPVAGSADARSSQLDPASPHKVAVVGSAGSTPAPSVAAAVPKGDLPAEPTLAAIAGALGGRASGAEVNPGTVEPVTAPAERRATAVAAGEVMKALPGAIADQKIPAASGGSAQSIASALAPQPHARAVTAGSDKQSGNVPAPSVGDVAGPAIATTPDLGPKRIAGGGRERAVSTEAIASAVRPTGEAPAPSGVPGGIDVGAAPVQANARLSAGSTKDVAEDVRLPRAQTPGVDIAADVNVSPLTGSIGFAPDSPFMRGPEQRKPLLAKLGGTKQSEDAVARALAYLARMQEPDGRWTRVDDDNPAGKRPKSPHDMACTGFSVLAFLAQNHTPDRPGPYRQTVSRAVDYLIATEDANGDLRGPPNLRGGGSDSGNMYDQGIATYALAECAIMTHDPRVVEAATRAARFIVAAQNRETGGWRYSPGEPGDSSVFGWQIMALHSAEQIGFQIPPETLDGVKRYLKSCEEGEQHLLGGYQPHSGPTPPMTAELLFCRMLLGVPLTDAGMKEATRFLASAPPDARSADLYYWYYASLSMLNMQNKLWKEWNLLTRESLIRMQRKDGPSAGSFNDDSRWSNRGGRVFSTAMATLTLEVYYRYLPLNPKVAGREKDAGGAEASPDR